MHTRPAGTQREHHPEPGAGSTPFTAPFHGKQASFAPLALHALTEAAQASGPLGAQPLHGATARPTRLTLPLREETTIGLLTRSTRTTRRLRPHAASRRRPTHSSRRQPAPTQHRPATPRQAHREHHAARTEPPHTAASITSRHPRPQGSNTTTRHAPTRPATPQHEHQDRTRHEVPQAHQEHSNTTPQQDHHATHSNHRHHRHRQQPRHRPRPWLFVLALAFS